jgi:cytoskeleton protein RodZ
MNSIGEALRRERMRRNLGLEQVARETKINVKLLEAIEAEDFSKLPGGVFAKSFVRQYARLLGLDEEEMVAELQQNYQPVPPAAREEAAPEPPPAIDLPRVPSWAGKASQSSSPLPALAGVVVVMLVCSAVYAWWQKSSRPEVVPAVESSGTAAPQAPAPAAPAPAPKAQEPQPAPGVADQQAPQQPPAAAVQPGAAPPPNVPAEGASTSAQRTGAGGAVPGNVRVVITAQEPTWISARSDGTVVYSGTLEPNEKKDLSAANEMRLVVGNAGGISVEMNGKPVPPLGPRGHVRVVQFSPGGVQIVPPKPPGSDPL